VAIRSNDRQTPGAWGVTNGIRADSRCFMVAYVSVEKDMVAYGSETWVRTHAAWALWEGHDMLRMLLIGHTIRVCQYWTYGRDQEGIFLAWS
jgi:hypothetical protein